MHQPSACACVALWCTPMHQLSMGRVYLCVGGCVPMHQPSAVHVWLCGVRQCISRSWVVRAYVLGGVSQCISHQLCMYGSVVYANASAVYVAGVPVCCRVCSNASAVSCACVRCGSGLGGPVHQLFMGQIDLCALWCAPVHQRCRCSSVVCAGASAVHVAGVALWCMPMHQQCRCRACLCFMFSVPRVFQCLVCLW